MKKIISIVTTLIMAFTIFVIPTWGFAYAGDEIAASGTETTDVSEDEIVNGNDDAVNGLETTEGEPSTDNPDNPGVDNPGDTPNDDPAQPTIHAAPTKPVTFTSVSAGYYDLTFNWNADEDVDGYAYKRNINDDPPSDNNWRDNGKYCSFKWGTGQANNAKLTPDKSYAFYVRPYTYLKDVEDTDNYSDRPEIEGATVIVINPKLGDQQAKEKYVLLGPVTSKSAKTKSVERQTKTKQSRGYVYRYYNDSIAKGKDLGTSYAMWNTIKNQSSKTKYLIAVDNKRNNVVVYVGKKGNWKVKYHWICCTGSKEHKSPKGVFKVFKKKPKFSGYIRKGNKVTRNKYTCWYATRFRGQCFFHSILYKYNSKKATVDTRLGMNISHGCVRLAMGNAKWIYNNIGKGTTVVSYDFAKTYQYK